MLYPDYAIKINSYARFLQIPKAYASHIGKNVFYKLFYPYLISPYKKKKKKMGRESMSHQAAELSEFFLFLFPMDNTYGLCQSCGSRLGQGFSPFPHRTVKFKRPAHSFLWNASGCQLDKIVLESQKLSKDCAD